MMITHLREKMISFCKRHYLFKAFNIKAPKKSKTILLRSLYVICSEARLFATAFRLRHAAFFAPVFLFFLLVAGLVSFFVFAHFG